jgi:transposase
MARTAKFKSEEVEEAKNRLQTATTIQEFRKAQAILLPALFGLTREQTGMALGLSPSRLGVIQAEARHPEKTRHQAAHGGRRRQTLTAEEEVAFLKPWEEKARTAGMVIVPPLHQALEEKLGRKVHHAIVYRLLARHGWRKVAPDSIHPKADEARQEDWKKTSGNGGRGPWQNRGRREKAPDYVSG